MHYTNTKKINGIETVVNFDPPSIDPEATKLVVAKEIQNTDVFKKIDNLRAHSVKLAHRRADLQRDSKKLKKELDAQSRGPANQTNIQKEKAAVDNHFRTTSEQLVSATEKAVALRPEFIAEQKRLFQVHAVRFQVRGSHKITAEKQELLRQELEALKPGTFLTLDGKIIKDNRRRTYLHVIGRRWVEVRVDKLGQPIPAGALWPEDLTADQKVAISNQGRTDALKALSPDERGQQKQDAINGLMMAAGQMKVGLEMDGDIDAESKAKKWLKDRKAEIEELYNVG